MKVARSATDEATTGDDKKNLINKYGKINYSWNHLDQVNMEYNNEDSTLKLEIYKHISGVSYVYTFSQIDQSVYKQIDKLLKQNVYPFEFWKKKEGEDTNKEELAVIGVVVLNGT